jgi:hypothetical protein
MSTEHIRGNFWFVTTSLISQANAYLSNLTAMTQMRAVLIKGGKGPLENLFLGDAPKPSPGAGEVIVKVRPFFFKTHSLTLSIIKHH